MADPRYIKPGPFVAACEACGATVTDRAAHTRFHEAVDKINSRLAEMTAQERKD